MTRRAVTDLFHRMWSCGKTDVRDVPHAPWKVEGASLRAGVRIWRDRPRPKCIFPLGPSREGALDALNRCFSPPRHDGGTRGPRPGPEALSLLVIRFEPPPVPATFLHRPNRFVVECELDDGAVATAHLPDPGRLKELLVPGRRVWLLPAPPGGGRRVVLRKTRWTAALVENPAGDGLVSLDTTAPNRLVAEALRGSALEELSGWALDRSEVPLGGSRFDFLLTRDGRRMALEVKSVTLVAGATALFPDAVTARGSRHLRELATIARRRRWRAAVLFVVQRGDAERIRAAPEIDRAFADALAHARRVGVTVLGRRCRVSPRGIALTDAVPVE